MEQGKTLLNGMEGHTCEIKMKLPSLNEYINLCRKNKYESAGFKKKIEKEISYFLRPLKRFNDPVIVHFIWHEKDKRRDADNIAFAKKFILDAMVKSGKLKDDSRKYVIGFTDSFVQSKETKVVIRVEYAK